MEGNLAPIIVSRIVQKISLKKLNPKTLTEVCKEITMLTCTKKRVSRPEASSLVCVCVVSRIVQKISLKKLTAKTLTKVCKKITMLTCTKESVSRLEASSLVRMCLHVCEEST